MEYWILQHNPANFSGDCPRPPEIPSNRDWWRIRRYVDKVSIGDVAFIWYAGSNRGIYNVGTMVSVPPHSPEAEKQISVMEESDRPCFDPDAFTRLRQYPAILIQDEYSDDLHPPLLLKELEREGFGNLPVLRMPRCGIYRLDQNVGKKLLEYIRRTRGEGEDC